MTRPARRLRPRRCPYPRPAKSSSSPSGPSPLLCRSFPTADGDSSRPSKFASVKSLTLFFPANAGADTSRIYFLGFKGDFSPRNKDPVITVYEATPNPADHKKIKGLDGVGREV